MEWEFGKENLECGCDGFGENRSIVLFDGFGWENGDLEKYELKKTKIQNFMDRKFVDYFLLDSLSKRSENLRYSFGKATVPLSWLKLNEAENNSKIEGELPKDEQQELDTLLRIFNVGER